MGLFRMVKSAYGLFLSGSGYLLVFLGSAGWK